METYTRPPHLELTTCRVVRGVLHAEDTAAWANKPWPQLQDLDSVRLPRSELGRFYLECTVLTQWQGDGGPWRVTARIEDQLASGRQPPRLLSSYRARELTPGTSLVYPFPITRTIQDFGDIVVTLTVNDNPEKLVRIAVLEG